MSCPSVHSFFPSIPKLAGAENYHDWKFTITMLLRRAKCWNIISETTEEDKRDEAWKKAAEEALTSIGLTIQPSQYGHIWAAKDGTEAGKALADVYKKNSHTTHIALKQQFYGYHHDTNNTIQSYISRITSLAAHIKSIGMTLPTTDITDVLIFNLDESYSNIASTLTVVMGNAGQARM
jgi:hypothetical protein